MLSIESVFRKHPRLLLKVPRGRLFLVKEHLREDISQAPRLWEMNSEKPLADLASVFFSRDCRRLSILYAIIRKYRPETIVETGVQNGFSSAFFLQAIKDNGYGKLYSIDLPNVSYEREKTRITHKDEVRRNQETEFVVPDGLREHWKLILGDARTELPALLKELGKIQCFFHDSMHTYDHMIFELNLAWDHMEKRVILSDDISWNGAFADFCSSKNAQATMLGTNIGLILKEKLH